MVCGWNIFWFLLWVQLHKKFGKTGFLVSLTLFGEADLHFWRAILEHRDIELYLPVYVTLSSTSIYEHLQGHKAQSYTLKGPICFTLWWEWSGRKYTPDHDKSIAQGTVLCDFSHSKSLKYQERDWRINRKICICLGTFISQLSIFFSQYSNRYQIVFKKQGSYFHGISFYRTNQVNNKL